MSRTTPDLTRGKIRDPAGSTMTGRFSFSPQMICAMAGNQGLGGAAAKLAVLLLNLPMQGPAYSYGELPTRLHLRRDISRALRNTRP